MTVVEFLDKLYETPRTWALVGGRYLRDGGNRCPLTALGHDGGFATVADQTLYVMGAADDCREHPLCTKIRAALLHACGLA